MPHCRASVEISFITDTAAKILTMQHIFAYNKLLWGYCLVTYVTFLHTLLLPCNTPIYRFRDIRGQTAF